MRVFMKTKHQERGNKQITLGVLLGALEMRFNDSRLSKTVSVPGCSRMLTVTICYRDSGQAAMVSFLGGTAYTDLDRKHLVEGFSAIM